MKFTSETYSLLGILYLFCVGFLSYSKVAAQTLIAGIPSADVTHPDYLALTHESQIPPSGKYWNSFNFFTYGTGKNTELCMTVCNIAAVPSH